MSLRTRLTRLERMARDEEEDLAAFLAEAARIGPEAAERILRSLLAAEGRPWEGTPDPPGGGEPN